jgi:hypothetical protein
MLTVVPRTTTSYEFKFNALMKWFLSLMAMISISNYAVTLQTPRMSKENLVTNTSH